VRAKEGVIYVIGDLAAKAKLQDLLEGRKRFSAALVDAVYAQTKDRCKDGCQKQRRFVEGDAIHVLKEWFSKTFKDDSKYRIEVRRAHPKYPSTTCYEAEVVFPAGVGMPTSVLGDAQSSQAAAEKSACYKALTLLLEAGQLSVDTSGPMFLSIEMERDIARAERGARRGAAEESVSAAEESVSSNSYGETMSNRDDSSVSSSTSASTMNMVGSLNEMVDAKKIMSVVYTDDAACGGPFSVRCTVTALSGSKNDSVGTATTKKQAKSAAARMALDFILTPNQEYHQGAANAHTFFQLENDEFASDIGAKDSESLFLSSLPGNVAPLRIQRPPSASENDVPAKNEMLDAYKLRPVEAELRPVQVVNNVALSSIFGSKQHADVLPLISTTTPLNPVVAPRSPAALGSPSGIWPTSTGTAEDESVIVITPSLPFSASYPPLNASSASPVLTGAPRSPITMGSPGVIWHNPIGTLKEMFDKNEVKSVSYSEAEHTSDGSLSVTCTVVTLAGREAHGVGHAKTKKQAKNDAALNALRVI
jgi:dsRNA-specific ribonuclease